MDKSSSLYKLYIFALYYYNNTNTVTLLYVIKDYLHIKSILLQRGKAVTMWTNCRYDSVSIFLFLSSLLLSKWPVGSLCPWCPLLRRQICPNAPAAPSTIEVVSLCAHIHTKQGIKSFVGNIYWPQQKKNKTCIQTSWAGVKISALVGSFWLVHEVSHYLLIREYRHFNAHL